MSAPLLKAPEKRFLSEFGDIMEKVGLPDVAGQVFAWLLICDPPCQTSDEIAMALGLDNEIAGQMGEMLAQFGMIEKVSLPDKQCYVTKPIDELIQRRITLLSEFRTSLDHAMGILKDQPEKQLRVKETRDFYAMMEEELPKIVACWEAGRKAG